MYKSTMYIELINGAVDIYELPLHLLSSHPAPTLLYLYLVCDSQPIKDCYLR